MYDTDCENLDCDTLIEVYPKVREVVANGKVVEMVYKSDIGLTFECPACGYAQSVWDEFNE